MNVKVELTGGRTITMDQKQYDYVLTLPEGKSITMEGMKFNRSEILGVHVVDLPSGGVEITIQPTKPKPQTFTKTETKSLHDQFKDKGLNTDWYDKAKAERSRGRRKSE